MSVPEKFQFGVVQCSTHTIPELLAELKTLVGDQTASPRTVLYVNAHVYNLACSNRDLIHFLEAARIVTADGMAIVWFAPLFGKHIADRCNMTEAFRAYLQDRNMPATTAILVGCSQKDAEAAARNVTASSTHCKVTHAYSGFLSDEEYRRIAREHTTTDFIFIGMGTPRSEQVTQIMAEANPRAIVWAIGGGTIRIYAGEMKEAPVLWRRLGLQWLYRLVEDPKTLWKRYVIGNPLFVMRVLKASLRRPAKSL